MKRLEQDTPPNPIWEVSDFNIPHTKTPQYKYIWYGRKSTVRAMDTKQD